MYAVVFGNLADGFSIRGPFDTRDNAEEYGQQVVEEHHWVCSLEMPNEGSDGCVHTLLKSCGDLLDDAANFITDDQVLPSEKGDGLAEDLTDAALKCRIAQ
jgi:hypothetical protein